MDASRLLSACLQELEYKHAYTLKPVDFRRRGSGWMIEVANRCAVVVCRVPPPIL